MSYITKRERFNQLFLHIVRPATGALLLFLIAVSMLSSCYSSRQSAKGNSLPALSQEEQRKYDYFFLEATRLKAKNEYAAAFDLYRHCLLIDPNGSSSLYEISQFYLFLQQPALALDALEKAVENSPDNYWYNQALASLYQQQDKKTEAIAQLEIMAERFPTRYESLFALINLYSQLQHFEEVIGTLNRLEDRIGKNEQISMEKFRIYQRMGDDKRAFYEMESLANEYPSDLRYRTLLGDVYLQNGRNEMAYQTYQKVLEVEPDNVMALFSLASFYEQTGQHELYRQKADSLLLNPGIPSEMKVGLMQQFISKAVTEKRDSTELITLFDRMLEQNIDNEQIPMLYAQYLLSLNMEEKAIPVLERVIEIEPANIPARATLLNYAVRKEDYEEVIRLCEPAIEIVPESLEFYFYLGIAYYQTERYDDALRVYRQALDYTTSDTKREIVSDFYNMIGDIYHQKEDTQQAYMAYDSALVYNPSNIGVLNNYAYYLSLDKRDLDRAEEMSYKTVKAEPKNSTYLDTYAWVLFVKGNYTEARIYIDEAMKNDGDESDVIVEHAGDIYAMNGETEQAVEYWKKSLEMGNDSKTLKQKIQRRKYIE